MAELYPAPIGNLLKRIFYEKERENKIFDLPASKFFHGDPGLDTSVRFHGKTASTPVGPAAGPQDQLIQNIILSWLGGARIVELKTIQKNDQLKIPRPCIDATNVGYNVEWSQELKLEKSLREYVAASMIIEILKDANILGLESDKFKGDTIFDMSVGYDLEGIKSKKVRDWIDSMKNATRLIDKLRMEIPDEFRKYRDFDFKTKISDTITLSTFHGCPADEIERITHFLLTEMDVHMTIKMNPTLLGKEQVDYLLHDVLGYNEIKTTQPAFEKDLQFDDAVDIVKRLDDTAGRLGKKLRVKFSNTLVVVNHKSFFPTEQVMYMSGSPLHVITTNLVNKFRDVMGHEIPISFSAGIDQHNFANAVAMNFTPITTCTDLLRPGGYARLHKFLLNLESKMRELGVKNIGDFIVKYESNGEKVVNQVFDEASQAIITNRSELPRLMFEKTEPSLDELRKKLIQNLSTNNVDLKSILNQAALNYQEETGVEDDNPVLQKYQEVVAGMYDKLVNEAGLLNTQSIVERTTNDPRYSFENNHAVPKKIGSHLVIYDCVSCNKCVPVCPNDANFMYETEPIEFSYSNFELTSSGIHEVEGGIYKIEKSKQWATYADFCNECGNCDVFCPEDGGPYIEKAKFFSSLETWKIHSDYDGFFVERKNGIDSIVGRINGQEYALVVDTETNKITFRDDVLEIEMENSTDELIKSIVLDDSKTGYTLDMKNYHVMKTLLKAILDYKNINYVNVATI